MLVRLTLFALLGLTGCGEGTRYGYLEVKGLPFPDGYTAYATRQLQKPCKDGFPGGVVGEIRKTLDQTGPDTIRVSYSRNC